MAYPTTKTTFSDPDGTTRVDTGVDHAALHTSVNDTIESIEDTVGTTAGTNVLKNFAAGDFPARINASNVLQQALSGTFNTSVLGTPTITGGQFAGSASIAAGTINGAVLGTPTITGGAFNSGTFGTVKINQGSDAEGDMYYRNSSGAFTRLPIGSNGQVVTTNGTTPSWGASNTSWGSVAGVIGTAFGSAGATIAISTVSVTSGSVNVLLNFAGDFYATAANKVVGVDIRRDGTAKLNVVSQQLASANTRECDAATYIDTNVPVGTYVYAVYAVNMIDNTNITSGYGNMSVLKTNA